MTNGVSSFANGEEIGGPGSLWADEEDKKFYEELRELKGEVPGSVLGIKTDKGKGEESAAVVVQETVGETDMDEAVAADEESCAPPFSMANSVPDDIRDLDPNYSTQL